MHYGLHIPITQCVLKCTKFPGKQANGYMFKKNCSSIEHQYRKLGDGFNKKRGNNKYTCFMVDKKILASSKKLKRFPRDFIFPIKQEDIWITKYCCISSAFIFVVLCVLGVMLRSRELRMTGELVMDRIDP